MTAEQPQATRKHRKPQKPSLLASKKHSKKQKEKKVKPPLPNPNPNLLAEKRKRKQKQKSREAATGDAPEAAAAAAAGGVAGSGGGGVLLSAAMAAPRQLEFFLRSFERAAKMRLSPLELESYTDHCMVELAEGVDQDVENFGDHVKEAFGTLWKEELCEGKLLEGTIDAGSPALLVTSSSALRSLELLRGLKMFTKECRAVKLFAKHLKVEEQVTLLKARVNIVCGTPSRIKKLIDMEALSLSRLKLVVLDMQKDAKSFSLFTLPQVSNEFWDLYKSYLDQKVRNRESRICFYGAVSEKDVNKVLPSAE